MGDKFKVRNNGLLRPVVLPADPADPPQGFMYYNDTTDMYRFFDGVSWHNIDTDNQSLQQVTGVGNTTTNDIVLQGTAKLDLSQTTSATVIPVRFYEQDTEPTLADGEIAWWFKTDTSQMYHVIRRSGVQYRVEAS